MMDCSYQTVYESYAKFCTRIGQSPLTFEDWMTAREEPETPSLQAQATKLLQAVENRM